MKTKQKAHLNAEMAGDFCITRDRKRVWRKQGGNKRYRSHSRRGLDAPTGAATQIHGVAGVCARAIELHAAYPTLYTRTRSTAREKGLLQHGSESETPRWFHTPLFSTVPVVECTGIYTYLCCGPVICSSTKTTAGENRSSLSPSQAHTSALASDLLISH